MVRASVLFSAVLAAAAATAAPAPGLFYDLEWRVAASVSRVEQGGLRTSRGEMAGSAELVLRAGRDGVLLFEWRGTEGAGSGLIGPGGPEHVSFPVPPEVGFPPAPPYRGGGRYTWQGEREQPTAFTITWIEAFH